ncbi:hypothetical protein BKG68_10295 [Mycobacteroides saopaulense]|uniref:WXG100 family type VII secretion target n=1 Tax=Mycobacteroides saopaulense TaxID=1578165 RepID=A0ABX3BX89_9MYCO|nr:hypothetical protein BKG68_10295 [Mycobacteroides saopaulense]OHU08397.1 hypothetical protein BKG73_14985 [Mycobacteroides saopaulense]
MFALVLLATDRMSLLLWGDVVSKDLRVVLAELSRAAGDLSRVGGELRSGLDGVDGTVTGMVKGPWQGGAANEYGKAWQQWDEGAKSVVAGLSDLADWMADTARDYERVDSGGA